MGYWGLIPFLRGFEDGVNGFELDGLELLDFVPRGVAGANGVGALYIAGPTPPRDGAS